MNIKTYSAPPLPPSSQSPLPPPHTTPPPPPPLKHTPPPPPTPLPLHLHIPSVEVIVMSWDNWLLHLEAPTYYWVVVLNLYVGLHVVLAWDCGCTFTGMEEEHNPYKIVSLWVCMALAWDCGCAFTGMNKERL